jgi:uncharacterized membrane protein
MNEDWQGTIHIKAPVEQVYSYLADFPRHCEWAQTLDRMEQVRPGDSKGIGTQYRTFERQAFQADRQPRAPLSKGMRGTTLCEVRELIPNRRIAWRAHPLPWKMGTQAELAFELAPHPEGGTTLTQTIHMQIPHLVMAVMGRLAGAGPGKAQAQWQASLQNIKAILEEEVERPSGRQEAV